MITQTIEDLHPTANIFGNKFLRRHDLTIYDRVEIAYTALTSKVFGIWGTVTTLAKHYNISRAFVYDLLESFENVVNELFGPPINPTTVDDKKKSAEVMMSLRLEGKCSIGSIVAIMKRLGLRFSSQGTISNYLNNFGSLVPNTVTAEKGTQSVIFLSDEIFANSTPILITVDPISSVILRIELTEKRRAKEWKKHWRCIENNGVKALYLVTDEGTGLCSAHEELFLDIMRQPDTYHAIAHKLGKWVDRLEKSAEKAITEEYDREQKINSAKREYIIAKRFKNYEEARKNAEEAIELYEDFLYIYKNVISELKPFDQNGSLRNRKQSEGNIEAGFELIESLDHEKINKAIAKAKRILPDLLNYFDRASTIVEDLERLPIAKEALKALCVAWQWNKAKIKAKKSDRKKWSIEKEQLCLELAVGYLQEKYDAFKELIYSELDNIVQSSALVECINSIIRPYLNSTKGHVNQEVLNLIMFYHNHRRYNAGKREKKTPMEIFTGMPQEKDWMELLFKIVEEKDPQFFLAPK